MQGAIILDNVKSANVLRIGDNVHIFFQHDGLNVEMVLTDELAKSLRNKLDKE